MFLALVVFVFSLFFFAFRINSYPLYNWDEAWYGEIIKNLVSGKHGWLVPFWNGHYYFDKPPLYFWLTAPIVHYFGLGEWQIRSIAVISGALAVLFTYLIAKHLFGKKTGVISALIFVSLGQVWFRFSSADLDSLQIFLFLGCVYFFLNSKRGKTQVILSGIFLGLSFLVKSWLVGLSPFVFLILYCLLFDRSLLRYLKQILLLLLFASGWWYLAGGLFFGKEFVRWYIFSPGAGNFISGVNYLTPYYPKTIISDFGFWLVPMLFLPFFGEPKIKYPKFLIISAIFSLIFLAALQLSSEKFNWYLLPLYPLFAICLAQLFSLIDLNKNKLFFTLLVLSFVGQFASNYHLIRRDRDRSRVGADLGEFVSQKFSSETNFILDDRDFPAFIYYSNRGHVVVTTKDGGKPREPWIISYQELKKLVRPYWVITQDWQKLDLGLPKEIINAPGNYRLVKFDTAWIKP